MFKRLLLASSTFFLFLATHLAYSENEPATESLKWGYDGETAPHRWGELNERFSLCSKGKEQSPIDLHWKKPKMRRNIDFVYQPSNLRVVDNGHTIQVNFESGSRVNIDGREYELVQLHFHSKSEHTMAKKQFPMEMHLVHRSAVGELAVVGVMFQLGKENPAIQKIWKNLPGSKNKENRVFGEKINPLELLPSVHTHFHYYGSLTTPPCSEGVNWNVLNTPVEISSRQLRAFRKRYRGNFRPVQGIHNRKPANF